MRPQVAEAALPGRGGNSSRLTVGSRRAVPVSALLKASPRLPAAAVGPVGSLSCTSSPSILAEAPAYRVAAASWNQVSRPLWMVEPIKPRLFPSPAAVPHSENRSAQPLAHFSPHRAQQASRCGGAQLESPVPTSPVAAETTREARLGSPRAAQSWAIMESNGPI